MSDSSLTPITPIWTPADARAAALEAATHLAVAVSMPTGTQLLQMTQEAEAMK